MIRYLVTKRFTSGLLAGMTIEEVTPVKFEVGQVVKPWWGSDGYVVVDVLALKVAGVVVG